MSSRRPKKSQKSKLLDVNLPIYSLSLSDALCVDELRCGMFGQPPFKLLIEDRKLINTYNPGINTF